MRLFKILKNSWQLILLHTSVLLILLGGMITWLSAQEARLTLSPVKEVSRYGVTLELIDFETIYYPGGTIPRDYVSHLLVDGRVMDLSVNKPLSVNGCKIYQQAYTPDGCSIVSVRKDAVGTAVTFMGYGLFAIGGALSLLMRRRKLLVVIAMCGALGASANESMAGEQVLYQGRVTTFSTVARDALLKIHGDDRFNELSAVEAVDSIVRCPERWDSIPLIQSGETFIALNECFDSQGNYIGADDSKLAERVGIIMLLRSGMLYSKLTDDAVKLSDAQVQGELLYNSLPLTLVAFILLFCAAIGAFFMPKLGVALGWLAFSFQVAVIAFEWWLTGYGPFASMFATLQLLAAAVALMSLLIRGLGAVGLLASGCFAMVAHLQGINPIVTPLMPVLYSPWLSIHVSVVMLAYALFVIIALLALKSREYDSRCRQLLRVAVYLLGLGICTGAVWANESWGRYWGWDPKETCALITLLIYLVPLHLRKPSRWWYILPLISVAMTYFGVNFLPSLHAYN